MGRATSFLLFTLEPDGIDTETTTDTLSAHEIRQEPF